jgi:hypothetical protein
MFFFNKEREKERKQLFFKKVENLSNLFIKSLGVYIYIYIYSCAPC